MSRLMWKRRAGGLKGRGGAAMLALTLLSSPAFVAAPLVAPASAATPSEALAILKAAANGAAVTDAQADILERSYVVSRLTLNERIKLRDRIYDGTLDLPGGVETAIIGSFPRRRNND